jgi:selenocysteine-specific elongation factor
VTLSFIDVPGHERFVRTMLAGAGGIDVVLLVVAADESVKPQTREHFEICRLLGLEHGAIAITKADLADPDVRELAAIEVRDLVRGSFLEGAPLVHVSARSGEGLATLVESLVSLAARPRRRRGRGLVRLPIDRVFTRHGFGTVVTGTLVSGAIESGAELVVEPGARPVRVRGVHVHGSGVAGAEAPTRAAVNLAGVESAGIVRGDTLASPGSLAVTRRMDVHLQVCGAHALRHGARVQVHQGTAEAPGRISIAARRRGHAAPWRGAQVGEMGVEAIAGDEVLARVRLDRPLAVTRHDRVVLRAPAPVGTIAGGEIIDPAPAAAGVRRAGTIERLLSLAQPTTAIGVWIADAGPAGIDAGELIRRSGASPSEIAAALASAAAAGKVATFDGRSFAASVVDDVERAVLSYLDAAHRRQPDDVGPPRESVREQVAPRAAPALFAAVIDRLARAGRVVAGDRLRLATHQPTRSDDENRAAAALEAQLRAGGLTPPDLATIAAGLGVAVRDLERLAQQLGRARRLIRLDDLWFHPDPLATLRAAIGEMKTKGGSGAPASLDIATFKTRFGVSRKFAIPLLEWLDRERVTRRVGDKRLVI